MIVCVFKCGNDYIVLFTFQMLAPFLPTWYLLKVIILRTVAD